MSLEISSIENEFDLQEFYFEYLSNNGIAHLLFDNLEREYNLEETNRNRIDIYGKINDRHYFYELKYFSNFSISQIYYKLGQLFLQVERYKKYMDLNNSTVKAIVLLPKDISQDMFSDISLMFRANKIYLELINKNALFNLKIQEIEYLKIQEYKNK